MAMTVTYAFDCLLPSGGRFVAGTAVASANYQTVGETMDISGRFAGSPAVVVAGGAEYHPNHNNGTAAAGVVRFYRSGANNADVLNQVTNGTNLSAVTIAFLAIGNATA